MHKYTYSKLPLYVSKNIDTGSKIYFCKPPKEKDQTQWFGKNYEKKLEPNAKFSNVYIFPDDTVAIAKSKIASAFNIKNGIIKLFCYNNLPVDIYEMILSELFKGRLSVPVEEYNAYMSSIMKTPPPHKHKTTLSTRDVPRTFKSKLIRNMTEDYKTIDAYNPYSNKLFFSIEPSSDKLIHFKQDSIYEQITSVYDAVNNTGSQTIKTFLNRAHIRVTENNKYKEDLFTMFSLFQATREVPFAKWVSSTNSLIKVNKTFAMSLENQNKIVSWSRFDKNKQLGGVNNEVLIYKILYKDYIATVTLFAKGMYDIKINLGPLAQNGSFMEGLLSDVQKLFIKNIRKTDEVEFKKVLSYPQSYKASAMSVTMVGQILPDKMIDIKTVENNIASLNHVFYPLRTNKGLTFLYKRSRHFNEAANIFNWMNRVFKSSPSESILQIMSKIFEDKNEVELQYSSWKSVNKNPNNFIKYQKTTADNVYLTVKQQTLGYKFEIEGCTNEADLARIIMYLRVSFLLNVKTSTIKKNIITLDEDEDSDDEDSDDEDDDDFFNDLFGTKQKKEDKKIEFEKPDGSVDQMREMKRLKQCPTLGGAKDRYVLTELNKADSELFNTGFEKTYAKICQSASYRQPLPLTKDEIDYNNKCFEGAITKMLQTGNNKSVNYACPKIWCPLSRVALTPEQFKSYGNKCPFGLGEVPTNFLQGSYFTSNERIIGLIPQNKHSKLMSMPCCFNKDSEDSSKESKRYIQGSKPNPGRYGALPLDIHTFLGNKKCGSDGGTKGHIVANSRCFLRHGTEPSTQSFMRCIVETLDIKSEEYIIMTLKKKIKVTDFILADSGRVFQRFIVTVHPDKEVVQFEKDFDVFKSFMMKNKDDLTNVFPIEMSFLMMHLKHLKKYNSRLQAEPYYIIMKQFYTFYKTYEHFLEYLDSTSKKTHDIMTPLLKISKLVDVNIIVIVNNTVECQDDLNVTKPCILLLLNEEGVYEPIHYVTYENSTIKENKIHSFDVPFLKQLMNCSIANDKTDEIKLSLLLSDAVHILGYDFKTIGLYTSDNIFIPFKEPCHISGFRKVCFINNFLSIVLKYVRTDFPPTETVKGYLTGTLNTYLGNTQCYFCEIKHEGKYLSFKGLPIPVKGCMLEDLPKEYVTNHLIDGEIFAGVQYDDLRMTLMNNEMYKQKLFEVFLNEILTLYLNLKDFRNEVDFIRHPDNPLSMKQKIGHLRKFFKSRKEFNKRIMTLNVSNPLIRSTTGSKDPIVCSKMGNIKKCVTEGPICAYDVEADRCKVKFLSSTLFEIYIDKAMYYLANPLSRLQLQKHISKNVQEDETITFSKEDIAHIDAKISNFLINMSDYEPVIVKPPAIVEDDVAKELDGIIVETEKPMNIMIRITKDFGLTDSLFQLKKVAKINDLFWIVYNKHNKHVTLKQFQKLTEEYTTPQEYAKLCGVNIIVTYRQSATQKIPYIVQGVPSTKMITRSLVIFHLKHSSNELFVYTKKNDGKFIFSNIDVPIDQDIFKVKRRARPRDGATEA
jgi:hypothetical protein